VLTGCKRIQDGIIRLEYKAGDAAREFQKEIDEIYEECNQILGIEKPYNIWDKREELRDVAEQYRVEKEDLPKTLRRFKKERKDFKEGRRKLANFLDKDNKEEPDIEEEKTGLRSAAKLLFQERRFYEKRVESLKSEIEDFLEEEIEKNDLEEVQAEVPTDNIGLLIQVAQKLSNKHEACVTLIGEKGAVSASQTGESAKEKLEEFGSENVQGDESFAKAFDLRIGQ
ncbi:MAG: hypothetical protein ACLFTA_03630, partial [Candidatus Nanohaloarchaea archaeon]